MPVKHPYEFWCVTEDGTKMHEYFNYSSTRDSKVKQFIENKYKIDIATCRDFGYRRNYDI
jgi:hypothetical protein